MESPALSPVSLLPPFCSTCGRKVTWGEDTTSTKKMVMAFQPDQSSPWADRTATLMLLSTDCQSARSLFLSCRSEVPHNISSSLSVTLTKENSTCWEIKLEWAVWQQRFFPIPNEYCYRGAETGRGQQNFPHAQLGRRGSKDLLKKTKPTYRNVSFFNYHPFTI